MCTHSNGSRSRYACNQMSLLYLGGQRDDNGLKQTELAEIKAMVRAHCAEVGATAASAETKLGSTKLVTYAKARYKAKIATWSLKEQQEIDKILFMHSIPKPLRT